MTKKLFERTALPVQMSWYVVVGGLAFAVDFVVFLALLPLNLTLATMVGYAAGTVANYLLSLLLAFRGQERRSFGEIVRFLCVCFVGLGLTLGIVHLLDYFGLFPVLGKIVATAVVFIWNFMGRRAFVFGAAMPRATWELSNRFASAIDKGRADVD